jgi:hypothetical protein
MLITVIIGTIDTTGITTTGIITGGNGCARNRLTDAARVARLGQLPLPLGQRAHLLPRRCAWASCSPARRPFFVCSAPSVSVVMPGPSSFLLCAIIRGDTNGVLMIIS